MSQLLRGSRLADGDRIKGTRQAGDAPDEYAFTLELGDGITWWKALIAVNENGQQTQVAEVQDDTRSADLLLSEDEVDAGTTVELWKAKAFGAHTHIYTLNDLGRAKGRQITLTWRQD
jgi:hypothetical protein